MNPIAIIIARGGSRRLPRKNVLPFCGRPLVEWSIIQARTARCLDDSDIFLSTDDDEIAAIGERNNIGVIRRPDWPNPDALSAMPVFTHAIQTVSCCHPVDLIFSILPTAPVRLPGDFDRVLARYCWLKRRYPDCAEVITLTPQRETVLWRREGPRGRIVTWDKSFGYLGPGQTEVKELAFWRRWESAMVVDGEEVSTRRGRRFNRRPLYYTVGQWYQAFDIDDRDSFELNEVLMERYILQGRGEAVYWDYKQGGTEDERMEEPECRAAR